MTIGALIRYADSPVGPYSEIVAAPSFLRRPFPQAHVAFIAVDSDASIVGGRANWALPKVPASFDANPGAQGETTVVGPEWSVRVGADPSSLRLPAWLRYSCCQVWPDATVRHFTVALRGRARPAWVQVDVRSSGPLGTWLASGRHPGIAFAGRLRVGAARP